MRMFRVLFKIGLTVAFLREVGVTFDVARNALDNALRGQNVVITTANCLAQQTSVNDLQVCLPPE